MQNVVELHGNPVVLDVDDNAGTTLHVKMLSKKVITLEGIRSNMNIGAVKLLIQVSARALHVKMLSLN